MGIQSCSPGRTTSETSAPFSYGEPKKPLYCPCQRGLGPLELATESLPGDSDTSRRTLNGIQMPYLGIKGLLTSKINEWRGQGLDFHFPWYYQSLHQSNTQQAP